MDFLQQFKEAENPNVASTMKAYRNALDIKTKQTLTTGAQLDNTTKLLDLFKGTIRNVQTKQDLEGAKAYFTKMGIPPTVFSGAENLKTNQEISDWALKASLTAEELIKMQKGSEFQMFKRNKDGTATKIKLTKDELKQYSEAGLISPEDKWEVGEPVGTPIRPEQKTQTIERDRTKVNQEYDVETGEWKDVSTSPVDKPLETVEAEASIQAQKEKDVAAYKSTLEKDVAKYKSGLETEFNEIEPEFNEIEPESVGNKEILPISPEEIARGGTGPYATLKAAFDAIAGGLGFDAVFGKEGFYQDTQENRHVLRTIKQLGKSALMNSSRGAVWEQQKIDMLFPDPDTIFRNPATESKKFKPLRNLLKTEKEYNKKAISLSKDKIEIRKLRQSNIDIDRLLSMVGSENPPEKPIVTQEDEALINKWKNK